MLQHGCLKPGFDVERGALIIQRDHRRYGKKTQTKALFCFKYYMHFEKIKTLYLNISIASRQFGGSEEQTI